MRKLFLICFVLISTSVLAGEELGLFVPYSLESSTVDSSLSKNAAVFEFEFTGNQAKRFSLHYSIDGKEIIVSLKKNERLIVETTAGQHDLQFLADDMDEVFMTDIKIGKQHRDFYKVHLQEAGVIRVVSKPVIYLYPQEKTAIEVTMDIQGENAFLYPAYEGKWKFSASPNGDLAFGDKTYNYLFWEADAASSYELSDARTGFFVKKNEVVSFLEEKLSLANLSSKEKADFITFWGPKLAQNKLNFVHFIFNQTCDQYAGIDIRPQPDNIYRVYIIWSEVDEVFEVEPQTMLKADRSGFCVIEWGGQEQSIGSRSTALTN